MATIARFRPSSAARWVNCPGYVAMSTQFPEPDEFNQVREEGTAFHKVLFHQAVGWGYVEVGTVLNDITVDEYMVDCAAEAVAYIRQWNCKTWLESPVQCPSIHPECEGTPDVIGVDAVNRRIYVFDAKYGYRPVSPYECWQLACYLVGVIDTHKFPVNSSDDQYWTVTFVIYQPRTPGPNFKEWTFNLAAEGRAMINVLHDAAYRASPTVEGAVLKSGPHCYKCSAAANCRALRCSALSTLDVIDTYRDEGYVPNDLSYELDLLSRAEDIIATRKEALTIEAESRIRNGEPVPCYTIKPGQSRIRWKDSSKAIIVGLAEAMGLPSIAKPVEPIGPRAAERLVGEEFIKHHTETPPGKVRLHRQTVDEIRQAFNR